MKLGIVGHAADKFTPATEKLAKQAIHKLVQAFKPTAIVSGHCHLGGVDIWAEEIAEELKLEPFIFEPKVKAWAAPGGYQERNLKIAKTADVMVCIVVAKYPPGFDGERFGGGVCYHCGRLRPTHVKSGGCWTTMRHYYGQWCIVGARGVEYPAPIHKYKRVVLS